MSVEEGGEGRTTRRGFLRRSLGAMIAGPALRAIPPAADSWIHVSHPVSESMIEEMIEMVINSDPYVYCSEYANEHWNVPVRFRVTPLLDTSPGGPPSPRHESRKGVDLLEHLFDDEPVSGHPGPFLAGPGKCPGPGGDY